MNMMNPWGNGTGFGGGGFGGFAGGGGFADCHGGSGFGGFDGSNAAGFAGAVGGESDNDTSNNCSNKRKQSMKKMQNYGEHDDDTNHRLKLRKLTQVTIAATNAEAKHLHNTNHQPQC